MMLPVYPVESTPLPRGERPQNRMVQHLRPFAKARLATRHNLIQRCNLQPDARQRLLRRHSFWSGLLGRLAPLWQIIEACHYQRLDSVFERPRTGQRFILLQTPFETLYRARVGEIEMLQNLCRTSLPFRVARQILDAHA